MLPGNKSFYASYHCRTFFSSLPIINEGSCCIQYFIKCSHVAMRALIVYSSSCELFVLQIKVWFLYIVETISFKCGQEEFQRRNTFIYRS